MPLDLRKISSMLKRRAVLFESRTSAERRSDVRRARKPRMRPASSHRVDARAPISPRGSFVVYRILLLCITALLSGIPGAGNTANASDRLDAKTLAGIWWSLETPWSPVREKRVGVDHTASGRIACFCANGKLFMINALLMKQERNVSISIGDSGSEYQGMWKIDWGTGTVTYRRISSGHSLQPVTLPGPEITESISMSGQRLRIGTEVFERTTSLVPESIQYFCPCDQR